MLDAFGDYSNYYDLLYEDRNYDEECDYLEHLWNEYSQIPVRSVLDLGCGTGRHSIALVRRTFQVYGIDRSGEMLAEAAKNAHAEGLRVELKQSDIVGFKLDKTFDVAISMFTVIGYLTSNEEITSALKNVRKHLKKGGLFIFDVWYGPAVLNLKPHERLKIRGNGDNKTYRFASPRLDNINNTVHVEFLVLTRNNSHEIHEMHCIRYFFIPELKLIAEMCDFDFIKSLSFLSKDSLPSDSSWNMTCVLRAK